LKRISSVFLALSMGLGSPPLRCIRQTTLASQPRCILQSRTVTASGYLLRTEFSGFDAKRIATIPDKGFFTILRRYGPTKALFGKIWKPDLVVKLK
jgi:hypothetical protein